VPATQIPDDEAAEVEIPRVLDGRRYTDVCADAGYEQIFDLAIA
jgi:hypothetical protein